jgi:hypothetical protein
LLSWRVRLRPYLDVKNEKMRFNEPWDSPHNSQFATYTPETFRCPSSRLAEGLTTLFLVKMDQTAFGTSPSDSVLIIEVDDEHAVVWTKPEDLKWSPTAPIEGLGRRHGGGFFHDRGCHALFADGSVHFIPENADQDLLQALFAGGRTGVRLVYAWHEALFLPRLNLLLGPYLLLAFVAVSGLVFFLPRLLLGKLLSPGEMLWLIAGASFLAHGIAVVAWYRYEPLPTPSQASPRFWLLPAIAGAVMSALAVVKFRSAPQWRTLFTVNLLIFVLIALDAVSYQQETEVSFVTAVSPVWLGCLAVLTAWTTRKGTGPVAWSGRKRGHWGGICVAFLPFLWLVVWLSQGLAGPGLLFVRVYY